MIQEESPLFTFRELRSEADYQAMVRVRQKCLLKYQGDFLSPEENFPSIELLSLSFPLPPNSKEEQTLILIEIEQEVIGYHHIYWWQHCQGMSYGHRGYLTPEWRGNGIGLAMLDWAEESLRRIGEGHSGAKQFRTIAANKETETIQRLLKRDYLTDGGLTELVHDLRQLPEPMIPLDFEIRPAEAATYRQIWLANESVFSEEPQRSLPDKTSYQNFVEEPGFDPSLWCVIWADDQIAGVAFSEITSRNVGHISQLSVGKQWRRQSLGRSLVLNSLRKLKKRGVAKVYVAADSNNLNAMKLYLKCGFQQVANYNRYWKSWNRMEKKMPIGKSNIAAALLNPRFPRSSKYDPIWVFENLMGPNVLWLTEALTNIMDLQAGMRILDLGCGKALSSIFLAKEFELEVWATDLWIEASDNWGRIVEAGLSKRVFPIHAEAHQLPFAYDFFDALVSLDAYHYFGTDDLYLGYISRFIRPSGQLAIVIPGLVTELNEDVPEHLQPFWQAEFWSLHSPSWWLNHWHRSGLVEVLSADFVEDGWKQWLTWLEISETFDYPHDPQELKMLRADEGRNLGFTRLVARRNSID